MPDLRTFFKRLGKNPESKVRDLTMRQVLSVKKTRLLPTWKQWRQLARVLSVGEKRVMTAGIGAIAIGTLGLLALYVTAHRIDVPAVGGEYTEGLVGDPQFINPLYAIASDADQDLTSLIYSGLLRWDPEAGFVPDLAESLQISEDGTIYTLKIKEGARFHDGEDVRARDIVFTINAIQNPSYRSPLADRFHKVSVVQEDDKTVSFILESPRASFTQYLTVGILPAGLWAQILPQSAPLAALNLQPVGSGPYKFAEFAKDKKGSVRSYTLERNSDYYGRAPYIERLTFKFYPDATALHDALENKNVEGASVVAPASRERVAKNKTVDLITPSFPLETILYFNQSVNEAFKDTAVRQAVAQAIDKASLVSSVYGDAARVIHAPILPGQVGYDETRQDVFDPSAARAALEEAGYAAPEGSDIRLLKPSLRSEDEGTTNTLTLHLTTVDQEESRAVAEAIKAHLRAVGIEVIVQAVAQELMATDVIDPRNFEMLLAPVLLEAQADPYLFWHSSQSKGAGLNLAGYANETADALLEQARVQLDDAARGELLQSFQETLAKDITAVFLYQSAYGYALAKKVRHPAIDAIITPSDRFARIADWYIKTKKALR